MNERGRREVRKGQSQEGNEVGGRDVGGQEIRYADGRGMIAFAPSVIRRRNSGYTTAAPLS